MNRGAISSVIFYILAIPITYLFFFLIFDIVDSTLLSLVLGLSVIVVFALSSRAVVTFVSKAKWNLELLGFRKKGLVQSFLLASAVSIIGPLSQLLVIRTGGIGSLIRSLLSGPAPLVSILHSLPVSLSCFLIIGVLAFGFFQALPCSFLEGYRKRWVVPSVVTMWALLYGGAEIVGVGAPPNLGDVVFLGFFFLYVYLRTRNSVGPIIAYVLLAEEQAWVALALLNSDAYVISLYVKISWSLIAWCLASWRWRQERLGAGVFVWYPHE